MKTILTSICLLLSIWFIWQHQFLLCFLFLGVAKCSQLLTQSNVFDSLLSE